MPTIEVVRNQANRMARLDPISIGALKISKSSLEANRVNNQTSQGQALVQGNQVKKDQTGNLEDS